MAFTTAGRFGPEAIIDGAGNKRAGALVDVLLTDGVTAASLYTDRTKATAAANPVLADSNGNLTFFADPGDYVIVVHYLGVTVGTIGVTVPIDPIEAAQDTDAVNTVSASGAGTVILPDPTTYGMSDVTLTGNATVALPSPAAGESFSLLLRQDGTGSRTVTWSGTIIWDGASVPTLQTAAGATDEFVFRSYSGASWRGSRGGQFAT